MNLIYAHDDLYCNNCHNVETSRCDGMVDPITTEHGIVLGFRCPDCGAEWEIT